MSYSDKRYIAFEGIDGSGKTTQSVLFCEFLRKKGLEVFYTREPGSTEAGRKLRDIILHQEVNTKARLFMFLADRSLNSEQISSSLRKGMLVVSDRSMYSTVAYQHFGSGIDREFIDACNAFAMGGIKPDVVFVIDLPVEVALRRRGAKDMMESSDVGFFRRVREGYLEMARNNEGMFVVDGNRTKEEVFDEIRYIWNSL